MRLRWLDVQWPMDVWALSRKMQERRFTESTPVGFMVDKVRANCLEGRFIERLHVTQLVLNPLGHESSVERTEYKITQFRAYTEVFGLEILDAPRGLEIFFAVLSDVCSFEFFFESISVDALAWYLAIDIDLRNALDIESLQICDVSVDEGVQANVLLTGRGDIRKAAELLTGDTQFRSEKLKARCARSPKFAFVLSRQGQASIFGQPPLQIQDQLRAALKVTFKP